MYRKLTCALPLAILFFPALFAQSTRGTLTGTVSDSQQAVVAGAQVVVANVATGQKLVVQTDATGNYRAFPLEPGIYSVETRLAGFRENTVSGIRVDLDSTVRVDVTLTVGDVQQSVTVMASGAALVQSETSSMESTVENQQIRALPLDGRNALELVYLTPGTAQNDTTSGLGNFVADGNRAWGNNFLIDGVSNRDENRGQSGLALSIDAVQEFKVKKSNASAEFGGGGSTVTLAVRNGTNQLHGALYVYDRSKLGQARNFFNPSTSIPPFLRNQFGVSAGGPIRRDHTFFFFNYEGSRITSSVTELGAVPTTAMRSGDFRSVTDAAGKPLTLTAPGSLPFALVSGQPLYSQPNVINPFYLADAASNPNRANANIANAVLSMYAVPNLPGLTNNFSGARTLDSVKDQMTARVDHQLTAKHTLSLRGIFSNGSGFTANLVSPGVGATPAPLDTNLLASVTSLLRPTLVSEFRFGWQKHTEQNLVTPAYDFVRKFGIVEPIALPEEPRFLDRLPTFSFLGNGRFNRIQYTNNSPNTAVGNDGAPTLLGTESFPVSETLTWQTGKHQLKFGAGFRWLRIDNGTVAAARGSVGYNGRAGALSSGYSVADALLGMPSVGQFLYFPPTAHLRTRENSFFVQDDWRIGSRITLNLGLRWEGRSPMEETRGLLSSFDTSLGKIVVASPGGAISPSASPLLLANFRSLIVTAKDAGWDSNHLFDSDWNDFGPRAGFAARLDRKGDFILRSSYGIFYSFVPYQQFANISKQVPFALTSQVNSAASDVLTNVNPFRAAAGGKPDIASAEKHFRDSYNQQWNLTLERVILREATLSVAYVGNRGVHLLGRTDVNLGAVKAYPNFGNVTLFNSRFNSNYNGLQVELRRRYSKGLFYQTNWTWAKSLDDVALGAGTGDVSIVSLNPKLNRADSDFVRRHVVRGNAVYELPFGRGRSLGKNWKGPLDAFLGGWSLGGIAGFTTGQFATPSVQGAVFTGRPDRALGVPAHLSDSDRQRLAQQTGDPSYLDPSKRWYNPNAFLAVDVSAGRIGNAARNTIVGPHVFTTDAVLSKQMRLPKGPERLRATLRIEAFNVFNHTNFDVRNGLNWVINTVDAGSFSSQLGNPRQFQFALRFDF